MGMQLLAKVAWANAERTRGRVILLWVCRQHGMQTRVHELGDPPPPCPGCSGFHAEARKPA
jgi:hypothetical protein